MATPTHSAQTLVEKIQSLPTDRIAEVEDFVDFLKQRAKKRKAVTNKKTTEFSGDERWQMAGQFKPE